MKYQIAPGVFDIIPKDRQEPWKSSYLWAYVEEQIRKIAKEYGYQEIRTPLFERTELFQRSVGETTDIVSKEMYTFEDRGNRSMSLRPEGTAPAIRSFIENQLHNDSSIHKLFYIASMFRYERTQAGRYRQHHQFGVEAIGIRSAELDAETIDLLYTLLHRLGLHNLSLNINSIGDIESRTKFRTALQNYFRPLLPLMSEESQKRFETNPLRILDSKDPRDREFTPQAPSILDYLDEGSKSHFEELKRLLNLLKIPYQVNPLLVRGLDYYNGTVFEIVAGELGAQNSVGGGGRYDSLIKNLGGPDLPAFGFGAGIERILQTMLGQHVPLPEENHPILYIIPLGEKAKDPCFSLLHQLREHGITAQMDFTDRKLGKIMQYADYLHAKYVAVIGDQELERGEFDLKEMASGHKQAVRFDQLVNTLKTLMDRNYV